MGTRGRKSISAPAKLEGNFLEATLPLRAFATLTTVMQWSQNRFDDCFQRWVMSIQAYNRVTIGWIKAEEHYPQRHLHVALIAGAPLDCSRAEGLWQSIAAPRYKQAGQVRPYLDGACGLGYILKELDSPRENIQFSSNISAFYPQSTSRFFGRNAAERRQLCRIGKQRISSAGRATLSGRQFPKG